MRIALGQLQVADGNPVGPRQLLGADLPHHLAGHAHDHRARRDAPPLGDECAGGDQALLADLAAGQQQRPHADQGVAADAAAVQHRPVADDDPLLDVLRLAVVGVDDAPVLHVDARPQRDARQVAADDRAVPQVHPGRQHHVARHHHAGRQIEILDGLHRY